MSFTPKRVTLEAIAMIYILSKCNTKHKGSTIDDWCTKAKSRSTLSPLISTTTQAFLGN